MRDSKKLSRSETISIIKDFRAGRLDDGIAKLHSHGLTVQFLRERLVGRYAKKEPEKEVPKEPRVEKY
jgi:hypothetical protein